ncbi:MAG: U32 family peptidase C-terminal domain-containing protein, partial [Clostridiaceae bacterium]
RPGEYFPVIEDDKGAYIMNSRDLSMLEHIPELMESGIYSFKVEGRMKSAYYVAAIVKSYRAAIDSYMEDPENYKLKQSWVDNLLKVSHRTYHTGFYFNEPNKQVYDDSSYIRDYDIVGIVRSYDEATKTAVIEQRNRVFQGDKVEVLTPDKENYIIELNDMKDDKGEKIDVANRAQMIFSITVDAPLKEKDMLIKGK